MRDRNLVSNDFCNQVEITILKWITPRIKDLRSKVVDNSNFQPTNTFFKMSNINLKDVIRLSIISWYCPPEVRFVLQEDLREIINKFSLEDKFLCEQFLSTKAEMLIFLLETNLWHTRDFFGNLLRELNHLDKYFKTFVPNLKVKQVQRKRGYHDHGSRVLDHMWLPKEDWSLTEEQNRIELERRLAEDTFSFNQGFLT